ncbi:MAG: tetratricopeptide repeat protein, partial [Prevotellaceae bacterium]|nr:tetratricopeptide repeat protein [Prevotellaceae bacterium]
MKKGDQFYAIGEYFDAAEQYKKAYSNTPVKERDTRGKRAARLAECYRRINFTQKAIAAYNNVIRYKQADSLTHLKLAQQLMKTGNYKQAEKTFTAALDSLPNSTLAKNGLRSAKMAPQWKKDGSQYTVKRADIFNSRRADYSPMLSGEDNDRLYFTST